MDRKVFYDSVRDSVFGGSLDQGQVNGTELLLDMWEERYPNLIPAGFAYTYATIYHESAQSMQPIKETVMPHDEDKHPSDEEVIRRLDAWYLHTRPSGVTPYWQDGEFGRGLVQVTHRANRVKLTDWFAKKEYLPNADFTANRDLLLDPELSALIAFEGIIHGLFRDGHWLAKYVNESVTRDQLRDRFVAARAIVNGPFRNVHNEIADLAMATLEAIEAAQEAYEPAPTPVPIPDPDIIPVDADWHQLHASIMSELEAVPDGALKDEMAKFLLWQRLATERPPDLPMKDITPNQPSLPEGFLLPAPDQPERKNDMFYNLVQRVWKMWGGGLGATLGALLASGLEAGFLPWWLGEPGVQDAIITILTTMASVHLSPANAPKQS